MVVRLRLARWGRKDVPFYRIVAADARSPRDGRHLEILGTFNPIADAAGIKELRVNRDRVHYWMSVGAQPSDRASYLFGLANVLPMPPTRQYTKKCIPKKDREAKK
uniref:30S ribosomal protein S16 putative n=1 Tax=Albugo laibachii Nc14 TaxID=890382 RepID=F0W1R9_9STRA|nr:30S ribosomal protein S16 putative [Albugo laibachii Nc14]CCA25489.1 30S ribosomal protein S16 putative [Albugo laibachii Nc14]|eukprot:CCA25489.1 30S ribosomal protein S16 putative [Albugo laibachii Nc14]